MKILYVENFRGFSNTYIPLEDINFLVGDNSTGKTSIMALIHRLSDIDFWHHPQSFNSNEVNLGHFKDIINVNGKDKKSFQVGYFNDEHKVSSPETPEAIKAIKISFKSYKGIPIAHELRFMRGDMDFLVKVKDDCVKYKVKENKSLTKANSVLHWFESWTKDDDFHR